MRRGLLAVVLSAALAIAIVGCGKDDDPPPTAPVVNPPPGTPEAEPNDSSPQVLGTLSATDLLVAGTASTSSDVDFYSVTLDSIRSLYTSLAWTGAQDLEVGVTDLNGIMVRNTDTAGNPEACTVVALPPGVYRVRVGSRSTTSVAYQLSIGRR